MSENDMDMLIKRMEERRNACLSIPEQWPPTSSESEVWNFAGLKCAVVKNPMNGWNGYVCLPKEHPDYGKWYDDISVDVHGGLTFCQISDDGFWIGFDTLHAGDSFHCGRISVEGTHWSKDKVKRETENLALQLAEKGGGLK